VESFNDFAKLTKRNVIVREGLDVEAWNKITYGFGDDCKYQIILGNSGSGYTMFYIKGEGQEKFKIIMPLAGIHNVLNATAAFIAARRIGVSRNAIAEALHTFMGVKRRFDVRINTEKYCYIDDYAHHPEEIRSCLQAIRDFYPNRRLTLVFQPHLYSRTRDFMDEFAEVLATADELILLDIYAAREEPIEGVSSQVLLDKIQMPDKKLVAKTQLIKLIDSEKPELLVTMGAGDIDRYVELFEELIKSW
jgi:UDP-N-acetylmuramate--alanine ligase